MPQLSRLKADYTALHVAVEKGDKEFVTILLSKGWDVDTKTKDDLTPFHIAAEKGYTCIAEELLNSAACISSVTLEKGYTPLHFAIKNRQGGVVKLLLQRGAEVDTEDKYGKTILYYAVEIGCPLLVRDVLKYCPNINNRSNRNSLILAVCGNEKQYRCIVQALLEYGIDINLEDTDNPKILHAAVKKGYLKIVEDLLKYGVDVNMLHDSTFNGLTPLHIAAKHRQKKVAELLISYGADINITCRNNYTPLDYAEAPLESFFRPLKYYDDDDDDDRYFDSGCGIPVHGIVIKPIKRHIVKLKAANLYVSQKNLRSVSKSNNMGYFKRKCHKEIARMKEEKINNTNISFYDILAIRPSSLKMYMRDENILQVLKSDDYKTKFPIYAFMIENHFRKSMIRNELLEQANEICHFLFNNFLVLPYDCTEKIFSYLSDKDLRIVINACKPPSICNPNTNMNDVVITSNVSQV